MSGRRIILVGATGMVGGCALGICLDHPDVSRVTVVGRRTTELSHPRLREILHHDFVDYTAVAETLEGHDLALYCLGAYTGTVSDDEFRRITVDYTVTFAKALHQRSPKATFCFLSGQGADQSEKSSMAFARYKGAAEKALLELGFPRVYSFRPGYIYPVTPRAEPNLVYLITRAVYPLLRRIYPNIGVSSEDLAGAMVHAGLHGTEPGRNQVLENRDIRALAQQAGAH